MPENFGDQLGGLVDAAASATGAPGAEAARKRGRRRRNRKRAAASALALALICGAGGAAALTLGNGPQQTPAVGPSAVPSASTVTGSATVPTMLPSAATTMAQALGTPSDVSPSIDPDPAASGSVGDQTTTTPPNPQVVVPAAWIGAKDLPFAEDGTWQPATATGAPLGDSVYSPHPPIEPCNEDIAGTALSAVAGGASAQQYRAFSSQGIDLHAGQAIAAYTAQQLLFYPDAAAAQAAWNTLPADFAACKQQITGTDPTTGTDLTGWVQQTLSFSNTRCWSTLATRTDQQSTSNGELTHYCFGRSGSLIAAFEVRIHQDGSFSVVDFSTADATTTLLLQATLDAELGTMG